MYTLELKREAKPEQYKGQSNIVKHMSECYYRMEKMQHILFRNLLSPYEILICKNSTCEKSFISLWFKKTI